MTIYIKLVVTVKGYLTDSYSTKLGLVFVVVLIDIVVVVIEV